MQVPVNSSNKTTVSTAMKSTKAHPFESHLPTFVDHHLRFYTYPNKTLTRKDRVLTRRVLPQGSKIFVF